MIHFLWSNIFKKISSKISCEATPQKYPYKFRLNSDDPMIHFLRSNILKKISSKISSVATKKNVCSVDKIPMIRVLMQQSRLKKQNS